MATCRHDPESVLHCRIVSLFSCNSRGIPARAMGHRFGRAQYPTQSYRFPPTVAKRGSPTRPPFTPEDETVRMLRQQGLSWKGIHQRVTTTFPQHQQSLERLRARYARISKDERSPGRGQRSAWVAVGPAKHIATGAAPARGPPAPAYVIDRQEFGNIDHLRDRRWRWDAQTELWLTDYLVR